MREMLAALGVLVLSSGAWAQDVTVTVETCHGSGYGGPFHFEASSPRHVISLLGMIAGARNG